ncbi:MAG: DUF2490 domain-containing protein [Bacteroidota bacterium]|nr:DUF2490 domain-containing protein [Bacteroidota bacterium]
MLAILSLSSFKVIKAQDYKSEVWGAYINSISLSNKWKIWNDYHYVTNGFAIIRPGITYQTTKGYQLTAGYAYVMASTAKTNQLLRQENRFWGQIIKKFQLHPRLNYIIRLRYDARFRQSLNIDGDIVENERTFNNRFRMMQDFRYRLSPIAQERYWHVDIINETLLNSGKQVINGFDQVRNYFLLGYTLPNLTLLGGYHQRFIPSKSDKWNLNHGFTLWAIHNIDLGNKKKAN